jgi:hypothetical protein
MTNTVILHTKARDILKYLKQKKPDIHTAVIVGLRELQEN